MRSRIRERGLVLACVLVLACSKPESPPAGKPGGPAGTPAASTATPVAPAVSCKEVAGGSVFLTWEGCSDGVDRQIMCTEAPKHQCECKENGVTKKTFDATAIYAADRSPWLPSHKPARLVEANCGWKRAE